jgi:PAS domain S-box-containing protein
MSLSSLTEILFSKRGGRLEDWALVDRIGELIRSASNTDAALGNAAAELGRALGLMHSSIILECESLVGAGAYSSGDLEEGARARLALLDRVLMRRPMPGESLIEIADPRSDDKLDSLIDPGGDDLPGSLGIRTILIAPIYMESRAVGALILYRGRSRRWHDHERHLIRAIASGLGLTASQMLSEVRAKAAAEREVMTNRMLAAIRSAVGIESVLKVAVESLGEALGVTRAVIYRCTTGNWAGAGYGPRAAAEFKSSVLVPSLLGSALDIAGSPVLGQLIEGETISIPDTSESHTVVRAIGVRLGVRAMALAPIAYNGQLAAIVTLEQFDRAREFTQDDLKLVRLVAEQTAVALYQGELNREAGESARRDALISKIGSAIHSSLDSDTVLQTIVRELGGALSACRCRLALLPSPLPEAIPITHEHVAECCINRPAAMNSIPVPDNSFLQSVLGSEGPVVVNDPVAEFVTAPFYDRFEKAGVKSMLSAAIRLDGRPIGLISLHHCEERHNWTQWETDIVRSVAEQAAVAIRQAELYRELRESAMRASLVNQIVASIRRSLDLKEALQVAAEELGRALGSDRTYFRKLVGQQNEIVAEYLSDPSLSIRDIPAPLGSFISNYLTQTRRTLIIDDVRAFAASYPDLAATVHQWRHEPSNLSQIVCPILLNGEYWGALAIAQTSHARKWTASEIALIEMVTAQIEVAVSHSHLFQEARQSAEREALVSHIIHGINQSNQLDEIFDIVARELGEHLSADSLLIARYDEAANRWVIDYAYRNGVVSRPRRVHDADDFFSFAPENQEDVVLCDDVEDDPRFAGYIEQLFRPAGTRAFMAVRLKHAGKPRLAIGATMKSGPRYWTSEEAEVIRAAANQVFTALQRAELFEQISQGKYQWEATFDALTDGIFIFDSDGVLTRVNEAGAAYEGADVRQMIGRRCCSLLQGIESENCRVAEVMKTGRPVTFELVPEKLSRPVLVTMAPLARASSEPAMEEQNGDEAGSRPRGAVCIVRDLSELRAAEAVAREQRSFLVKLIEHANDAIFAFSPEGRLIWFNEQLTKLSGYTREELSAADYRQFLLGTEKKIAVDRFTRSLGGEAQTFELHGLRKDGEARLLLMTYTPIYDEGRIASVLAIARDITEERLASERAAQADKLRALGQLASGVAHNFNNILAAILGHAQLIRRDSMDDRTRDRMEIIERAALDGAQTVKRIQGFALQQNESASEPIDINQILQDSANLTRARWCDEAQARGLQYEVSLELNAVPVVQGSASELREVFVNIILNALDAMPQGGKLRISSEARGSFVNLTFADTGIGMARDVSERIFEPFFTTKGVTGMGLGLAVSYSIVERHGGRIEAQSVPGRGTSFIIMLPVGEVVHVEDHNGHHMRAKAANVLVVDDDERVREALVGMLSSAGHRTDYAANGREALAKMERDRFELVFTDLSMPGMDGWAVAGEIRRRWPGVKIVLITGYAVPPETVTNNRELVNDVIFKPIRFDDISATLSEVLS